MPEYTLKELRELIKNGEKKDIKLEMILDITGARKSSSRGSVRLSKE